MRAHPLRIPALLLAGAMLNVLIAWSCSLWSPVTFSPGDDNGYDDALPEPVERTINDDWTGLGLRGDETLMPVVAAVASGPGLRITQIDSYNVTSRINGDNIGPFQTHHLHAAGWPMRSLMCHAKTSEWSKLPASISWHAGIPAPDRLRPAGLRIGFHLIHPHTRPLPFRPLWVGFATNTLLLAAIAGALLYGHDAARRRLRRRRGDCPACGYDLRATPGPPCPECGAAPLLPPAACPRFGPAHAPPVNATAAAKRIGRLP